MSVDNLEKIFHPRSIAVVGASERTGSVGHAIMQNLINSRYGGDIYPINAKHRKLWGKPSCASIAHLSTGVDLAVLATPIASAPQIIRECVATGVGSAIIISAGGKEVGIEGKKIEAAIKKETENTGLRIIGPNCVGLLCTREKVNASFAKAMPLPGKMAFISQSGAICTAVLDLSLKEKIGFSHFVSLGDMLDVDFGDVIDYLGGERDVSSIVMYVESLTHFRKFMSAARAVSRVKPIIALKAGRTKAGSLAAASHTGALAGEDAVYDAAFERAGILRVKTFEELFDCAEMLSKQPRPGGPGLLVITNAGGLGVIAMDALADYGLDPVELSPETIQQLDAVLPPFWSKRNPIDMLGDATPETYQKVVTICMHAAEVNGLLIMSAPQALTDTTELAVSLVSLLKDRPMPIFTSWVGGVDMEKGRDVFNQAGIATFDTPERAVRAFADIYRDEQNKQVLQQIPSRLQFRLEFDRTAAKNIVCGALERGNHMLTEPESKALLSMYGIPVNRVANAQTKEDAVRMAVDSGFPVVMKINSRDITHKSDAKGVRLGIKNEREVCAAFESILQNAKAYNPKAKIQGVTVQPMLEPPDHEVIVGAKQDRDFGPVILFGMGGVATEILSDRAIALPPLNHLLAARLMKKTKIFTLLKGFRGTLPANIQLLEEILIRLSQLVTDFAEIDELDINPVFVTGDSVCAVDARVLLKTPQKKAPLHLVISPYPEKFEEHVQTRMGVELFIRPIRPEDAPLLVTLFDALSPRSVYLRFFTPLKRLSHSMLVRFTQIDYDREIAMVALAESPPRENVLGVARIISERNLKDAEFSVVVADAWHGKGIGAMLLQKCLVIARNHGLERVHGVVLAENTQMLALGKKLGFQRQKVTGANEYELKIELQRIGHGEP
jgi:acetyltransferase